MQTHSDHVTEIVGSQPILLSFPHSGRLYPDAHLKFINHHRETLRVFEDPYLDIILPNAQEFDAFCVINNCARAFIDVNRSLDHTPSSPILDGEAMGLIPTTFACGKPLYSQRLHKFEIDKRISQYYHPFHQSLKRMIGLMKQKFDQILIIDCHSMPSKGSHLDPDRYKARPDIILGNRFGHSTAPYIIDTIEEKLIDQGLSVFRNYPYAGGHIINHYKDTQNGIHALQIEINRHLYVCSHNLSLKEHSKHLAHKFQTILKDIRCKL